MVLNCSQEPVWTGKARYVTPETLSEYALNTSKPRKVEMAASSIYGTLPRAPKYHRRQMSEATIPVKYLTDPGKPSATKERKKSFLVGLKKKIRYAVDGKPKLNGSRSDDMCGSTGSLYHEKTPISTHSGHSKDDVFRAYPESSSPNSSAPSSPESRRSSFSSKRARRSKARSHNTNRDSFGSISPEETAKKSSGTNVLIVGGEGVGKSALTVRFLTKRYIGEYAPEIESVYDQTINLEGKDVNVNIWDSAIPEIHQTSVEHEESTNLTHSPSLHSVTSSSDSCHVNNRYSSGSFEDESAHGLSRKNRLRKTINKTIRRFRSGEGSDTDDDSHPLTEAERRLRWADGLVVVYSICDPNSYKAACDVIRYVRDTEFAELNHIPILLLGNKADLHHRRLVDTNEARVAALQSRCAFTEISVSEGYEPVSNAMKDHIKTIRNAAKSRSKSRKTRS